MDQYGSIMLIQSPSSNVGFISLKTQMIYVVEKELGTRQEYNFYATVESCGTNITLESENDDCSSKPIELNQYHTSYIDDKQDICLNQRFQLNVSHEHGNGIWTLVGEILLSLWYCCWIAISIYR